MQPGSSPVSVWLPFEPGGHTRTTECRRAVSLRHVGEDARYLERPHAVSPPFPDLGLRANTGDALPEEWFPVVWERGRQAVPKRAATVGRILCLYGLCPARHGVGQSTLRVLSALVETCHTIRPVGPQQVRVERIERVHQEICVPPIRPLMDSASPSKLQMKVPDTENALELVMIVSQAGDDIALRYCLLLVDENFTEMAIYREQGFAILVIAMIDDNCRTPAFLDVRFYHCAVSDGDHRLSGRPGNVNPLMNRIATFPVGAHPTMEIGDNFTAAIHVRRILNKLFSFRTGVLRGGRTCRQRSRDA